MSINVFKAEKDSLAFLGLMSRMYKMFDEQFVGPDGERTHQHGLNIHALIIDNATGAVLGMQHNTIHDYNNPLLHAEQLTLKEAVEKRNKIAPRNPETTSVEGYYRNYLFNDPSSYDAMKTGATIYTTLEPCPYCTAALLVSRVKRIVYITPDMVYGNSFYSLWSTFYRKYDIHYEQFKLDAMNGNDMISTVIKFLNVLIGKIAGMKDVPSTLYFDSLKNDLKEIAAYFNDVSTSQLISTNEDLVLNSALLADLKQRVSAT